MIYELYTAKKMKKDEDGSNDDSNVGNDIGGHAAKAAGHTAHPVDH